jgi:chromosome partitioning protein
MKVVVVANAKGGVGKTTLAINLAIRAACGEVPEVDPNKSILICDMDAQQNTSQTLLQMEKAGANDYLLPPIHPDYNPEEDFDWDGRSSSTEIYYDNDVVPYPTVFSKLDVLPANGDHLELFQNLTKNVTDENLLDQICEHFRKFIEDPDVADEYDMIVFDTPPGKNFITIPVFRAATDILMPFKPEGFSVEGLAKMKASIEKENEYRDTPVKISGMVPNLVKHNNKHRDTLVGLHNNPEVSAMLWDTTLHDRVAFVLDNMPLSETNFRYHDPKAEEEMTAVIQQFRHEVYGTDITSAKPQKEPEEEQQQIIEQAAG